MILEGNGACPKCDTFFYKRGLPYVGRLASTVMLLGLLSAGLCYRMKKPPRQELINEALAELIPDLDARMKRGIDNELRKL